MFSQLFYFFTLICVLSETNLYISGSLLGDLFRAGGNVNYQLADVSDDAVNRIRDTFQPPVEIYGKGGAGVGGRLNGNIGYNNIDVAPPNSYDFYRSFAPSGNVRGQVDMGASLTSASGALLTPESTRTRFSNAQQGTPPIFRYFEN